MIPRGTLYIGWRDLAAALAYCAIPGDAAAARDVLEREWAPNTVSFLSVRSGLDALLSEISLPSGSEIIVSAITIPHILDIVAHHALVPVPVDLDLATLAVDASLVSSAVTTKTRAVLVAHLFGSRMPLDEIAAVTRARGLLLIEDCAQAYDGSDYRGHAGSDVAMFSFGPIKRQTALGGALLRVRDPELARRLRTRQRAYPRQPRSEFAKRALTIAAVKVVTSRPGFRALVALCRWRGRDHDAVLGTALRGFAYGDLFARLRRQPSAPMIRLLVRRLRQSAAADVASRVAVVDAVRRDYPSMAHPGARASGHRHWLFPVLAESPDTLMRHLRTRGFDATRGASNLTAVPAPTGRIPAAAAERFMREVVYLPLFPASRAVELRALAAAVRDFDSGPPPRAH